MNQHSAETLFLRLDCHLPAIKKEALLKELDDATSQADIAVFYYLEKEVKEATNLMLFFTNGRTGLKLQKKKKVNTGFLQTETERLFKKYDIKKGHTGGWENYPRGQPVIRKITDAEYIIEVSKNPPGA